MGSHDQRNDHSTNLSVTGSFLARDAGKIYPRHHEYLCGLLSGCILSFSAPIVVIISRVIGTNVHTNQIYTCNWWRWEKKAHYQSSLIPTVAISIETNCKINFRRA